MYKAVVVIGIYIVFLKQSAIVAGTCLWLGSNKMQAVDVNELYIFKQSSFFPVAILRPKFEKNHSTDLATLFGYTSSSSFIRSLFRSLTLESHSLASRATAAAAAAAAAATVATATTQRTERRMPQRDTNGGNNVKSNNSQLYNIFNHLT
jgi:uncharacterized membrane protein